MATVKVLIELEIKTEESVADVIEALGDMLDNGVPQDTVNDWEDLDMHVTSAVCRPGA